MGDQLLSGQDPDSKQKFVESDFAQTFFNVCSCATSDFSSARARPTYVLLVKLLFFCFFTSFSCCLFPSLVWRYVFGRSLSSVFSLFYQIFACPLSRGSRRALGAACSSAAALAASSYRETNSPTLLFFLPAGASAQRDLGLSRS